MRERHAVSSTAAIAIADLEGKLTYVSDSFLKLWGYEKAGQVLGRSAVEFWQGDDDALQPLEALAGAGSWAGDLVAKREDGSSFHVQVAASVAHDGAGNALIVLASVADPLERRREEEGRQEGGQKTRASLHTGDFMIVALDTEERVTSINARGCELLACKEEEIVGHDWFETAVPERFRDELRAVHEKQLAGEFGPSVYCEIPVLTSSGEERLVAWQSTVVRGGDGRAQGSLNSGQDVTGYSCIEGALSAGEQRYCGFFRQSRDAIYIVDRDGRIVDVNQSLLDLFGCSADDMTRAWVQQPCLDDAEWNRFRQEIEGEGAVDDYEISLHKQDGTEMDCLLNATVRRAGDGTILGYQGIIRDITERKRAEEALREGREFCASLLENSPNPIIVLGPDTRIEYVNPALEAMTGFSSEELLGQKAPYPWWTKETLSETSACFQDALRVGAHRAELLFQRKDGHRFWVEVTSTPTTEGGDLQRYVANWVDITGRKQAADEIRRRNEELKVLNAVAATVAQSDSLDGMLGAVLETVLELLDLDMGCICLLERQDGAELRCPAASCFCYSGCAVEGSNEVRWREGMLSEVATLRDVLVVRVASQRPPVDAELCRPEGAQMCVAVPIESEGRFLGMMALCSRTGRELDQDENQVLNAVGHQIGAAVEKAHLSHEAAEIEIVRGLDRLRSQLIANVSHELRSPLGLIKMACSSLLREDVAFDRKTERRLLRDAEQEADKLRRMVDDLLDLSQMEASALSLNRRLMDVGDVVRQAVEYAKVLAPQQRLTCTLPDEPLLAEIDDERIEQVLRNLLTNAIRYSTEVGTITVEAHEDAGEVSLSVRDEGIGIPPGELEKVFEPFHRVDSQINRKERGAGLGLALCRSIVETHGGRIWAESKIGEGTTFHVRLPKRFEGQVMTEDTTGAER
jgi:PAS domain S-box-containing protein